jgi:hypothetical protein
VGKRVAWPQWYSAVAMGSGGMLHYIMLTP